MHDTTHDLSPGLSRSVAQRALLLVRTSRPIGWIAAVGLFRIGMAYGFGSDSWRTVGLSIALTFPFGLYLFGLNDVADASSDWVNPRKGNWLHGERPSTQDLRLIHRAAWIAGAIVLFFAPLLGLMPGLILSAVVLLGWLYSSPPLRLKEVPIVDGLVTSLIMLGLLGVGYSCVAPLREVPPESYAPLPTIMGLHIFASVVDVDSDRRAGHVTLAVRVGPKAATLVALGLSLFSAATVLWLDYAPAIKAYVLGQPVVLLLALFLPRLATQRRALALLGLGGIATLLHLALIYLR